MKQAIEKQTNALENLLDKLNNRGSQPYVGALYRPERDALLQEHMMHMEEKRAMNAKLRVLQSDVDSLTEMIKEKSSKRDSKESLDRSPACKFQVLPFEVTIFHREFSTNAAFTTKPYLESIWRPSKESYIRNELFFLTTSDHCCCPGHHI